MSSIRDRLTRWLYGTGVADAPPTQDDHRQATDPDDRPQHGRSRRDDDDDDGLAGVGAR
ncbi:hypothetical protein [Modestobacter sp. Leaf380]|uniref:hypothetical protein n=1 Tax=Modestobacter sp. Leaf380 TaxID=1736356 RepID=UPI000A8ECEC6|nr:hypothetical protein [Modestobacter sp. Leaf380]